MPPLFSLCFTHISWNPVGTFAFAQKYLGTTHKIKRECFALNWEGYVLAWKGEAFAEKNSGFCP